MIYCLIPRELATELKEELQAHYAGLSVEVLVDRRRLDRRWGRESGQWRSSGSLATSARRGLPERRTMDDRRPPCVGDLPGFAVAHAERITFVALEGSADTSRQDDRGADQARLAAARDPAVFERLYVRYYGRVYRQLVLMLNDRHEAEDVAQDVFVRLHGALSQYDETVGAFESWLYAITRNAGMKRLARSRRYGLTLEDAETVFALRERELDRVIETDPAGLFDRDVLHMAARLPRVQRQVLSLRFVFDLDQETVGELLGKSAEAIRKLEGRAKDRLKTGRLSALPHGDR